MNIFAWLGNIGFTTMLAFVPTIIWQSSVSDILPLTPDNFMNVLFADIQNDPSVMHTITSTNELYILWLIAGLVCLSGAFFFVLELLAHYKDTKQKQLVKKDTFSNVEANRMTRSNASRAA